MRTHTFGLALVAAAFATLGLAGQAHAQTTTPDATAMRAAGGQRAAEMMKSLNLSAEQQTKVEALMAEERAKGGMMGGQSGPPSDADRQAMQTRRAEMETKLKAILTPEQYTKYQAMRPQRGQRPPSTGTAN